MAKFAVALLLAGVSLTACQKAQNGSSQPVTGAPIAALPLASAAPPPTPAAPPASALPWPSRPIRYAADRSPYHYLDQAYRESEAFGDTPPDYTVDYDGSRPWIWRADNGAYRVVERLPEGERTYYYAPGAREPYLVTDPSYHYAYDNGDLVGVYDDRGTPLPEALAARRAYDATRYLDRARALHSAAMQQQRQSAYAEEWRMREAHVRRQREQWAEDAQREPEWRSWHDQHASDEQAQWGQERDQRSAYATALGATGVAVIATVLSSQDKNRHDQGRRDPVPSPAASPQPSASPNPLQAAAKPVLVSPAPKGSPTTAASKGQFPNGQRIAAAHASLQAPAQPLPAQTNADTKQASVVAASAVTAPRPFATRLRVSTENPVARALQRAPAPVEMKLAPAAKHSATATGAVARTQLVSRPVGAPITHPQPAPVHNNMAKGAATEAHILHIPTNPVVPKTAQPKIADAKVTNAKASTHVPAQRPPQATKVEAKVVSQQAAILHEDAKVIHAQTKAIGGPKPDAAALGAAHAKAPQVKGDPKDKPHKNEG